MGEKARAHAVIRGRVQGVFFRMETQRAAEAFNVSGWVRNNRDGTVEAVFEGEKPDVEAMLSWCEKGAPRSRVDHVDVSWEAHSGTYSEFSIRH